MPDPHCWGPESTAASSPSISPAVSMPVKTSVVDNEQPTALGQWQVRPESRSIHRNQYVAFVAWSEDFGATEAEREAYNPGGRVLRGADFCGIGRESGDLVAVEAAGVSKLRAAQLHAVAGIPSKDDNNIGSERSSSQTSTSLTPGCSDGRGGEVRWQIASVGRAGG